METRLLWVEMWKKVIVSVFLIDYGLEERDWEELDGDSR